MPERFYAGQTIPRAERAQFFGALPLAAIIVVFLAGCPKSPGSSSSTSSPPPARQAYFVNCSVSAAGNGTQSSPWHSLASVAARTFQPGDQILFQRGVSCSGMLAPQGSGTSAAPIVIDAYGSGALPVINGGSNPQAVKLFNQQYWEIRDLEIVGGNQYGVFISGDQPSSSLNHIHLLNLNVHGATFPSKLRSDSGEVVITSTGLQEVLNDVLVDGVIAHDTTASQGIFVSAGGSWTGNAGAPQSLGNNVTVQNSTAYNVGGDGIMIAETTNGLLQNNVVYQTGQCASCTGSTPNGLWEWYCHTCTVQNNESYANKSWFKTDGGDYDIDYYDNDNVVQYNYGHDSAGYCVSVFGSDGTPSVNSIVRYNICSNDGQSTAGAYQGEILLYTWNGGSLDGVQVYNNTLYWNPAAPAAAFNTAGVIYAGSGPRIFMNNIIYSAVSAFIQTTPDFSLDNNIYWTSSSSGPSWQIGSTTYTSLPLYQAATNQDAHSLFTDPMLANPAYHAAGRSASAFTLLPGSPARGDGAYVCAAMPTVSNCSIGLKDFFGNPLPSGSGLDIGANQAP
jgi:hypothetical protein